MSSKPMKATRRSLLLGGAALALLVPMIVPTAAQAAPAPLADISSFGAGTDQPSLVVPNGVCYVNVSLGGAYGGISVGEAPVDPDDPDNPGTPEESGIQGAGAVVNATLNVQAGTVLSLKVGGNGANGGGAGWNGGGTAGTGGHPGGGGGGYTSLELGGDLLLLAAGGGGSGGGHQPGFGAGGDAGFGHASQGAGVDVGGGLAYPATAGGGGYDIDSDYTPSDYDFSPRNPTGGGAASATAGGAGGVNDFSDTDPESSAPNYNGFAGSAFQGGNGGNDPNLDGSGGGGGGYFGGGGGAATQGAGAYTGSGGGGGSSYVADSALLSNISLAANRVAEGQPNEGAAAAPFATFQWVMCDYTLAITKSVVGVVDAPQGDLVRETPVFEDGDIARYSVTVTNSGSDIMAIGDTVTIIDDLAVGGTIVSVTGLGSTTPAVGGLITAAGIDAFNLVGDPAANVRQGLAVGQSVTVVYDVAVTGDEAISNTASTSDRNGPRSDVAVIAPAEPSLELEKSADTAKIIRAGQIVTYSFLVTNTGNIEVSDIAIDEGTFTGKGTFPTPTCPEGVVEPGEAVTCTAEYIAVADDLTGEAIENTATAAGETPGGAQVVSNVSDAQIDTVLPPAPLAATGGGDASGFAIGGALLLALGVMLRVMRRRHATEV